MCDEFFRWAYYYMVRYILSIRHIWANGLFNKSFATSNETQTFHTVVYR